MDEFLQAVCKAFTGVGMQASYVTAYGNRAWLTVAGCDFNVIVRPRTAYVDYTRIQRLVRNGGGVPDAVKHIVSKLPEMLKRRTDDEKREELLKWVRTLPRKEGREVIVSYGKLVLRQTFDTPADLMVAMDALEDLGL